MRIALAGNPNSGKTTLFNLLTGSTAHVGNYPGVTVEKREGVYKTGGEKITVIDLPGIYSLSPYSPEEVVSRNVILEEKPDAIINIVDATNLERNLYLTTQLLETDIPIVIALNMIDVAVKNGISINCEVLSSNLGVPVVPISALKKTGIKELMSSAAQFAGTKRKAFSPIENSYLKELYLNAAEEYTSDGISNPVFHAVKAVENDEVERAAQPEILEKLSALRSKIDNEFEGDFEGMVADLRYKYIGGFIGSVLSGRKKSSEKLTRSDKADKVLTHRIWGIPLFLLIMFGVFHLTFGEDLLYLGAMGAIPEAENPTVFNDIFGNGAINSPGVILQSLVTLGTDTLTELISGAMPEGTWYTGLVVDGLCGGLFSVLSFIPQILLLFLFLSILEDTGYMARVAFIMDRAFRKFGLSGKAFMPLLMCFGCAVPGIMATRTLENEKERRMAIILAPFFSCGAKLPIWGAFAAVLFNGSHGDLIVFSMYFLGIAVAVLSSILLKKTALKGATAPFIMELPAYHLPQFKNTMLHLWEKLKHYIVRAATIIAGSIVVIWFLTNFDFDFWNGMVDQGDSILGRIAKVFSWLFVPLGFGMGENGWMFVVAAFTGLIAKEMVVATLGTFAGVDDALDIETGELASTAFGTFIASMAGGYPAALAFMAFNLLSVPCMAAVGAASGEFRSKKKLWFAIGYWMATAYIVSALIFVCFYFPWVGITFLCLIAALIIFLSVKAIIKRKTAGASKSRQE